MILLKTDSELERMREANRIVAVVLDELQAKIRPGVHTLELDRWAEGRITGLKGLPAFKGYGGRGGSKPFPATLCTSVNEEVVHGIPSASRMLREGDIVGIDVGVLFDGYYGDGARTYAVGSVTPQARELMDACQKSLQLGIEAARPGNHLGDIAKAIDGCVRAAGFSVVRDLSGHGIGSSLHEDPQVLNYYDGRRGPRLKSRMTLAIEPMINAGSWEVRTLDDGWTVVTCDSSLSAHYEHTVALTDDGPEILTRC
ncbi:MAG: type I methionyl aminopeptidase [Acidobacteria bacterium]|jgi:methionyl aminopeptidase|nr:type I methionyl aminopeptidase [Acidobacteriota bacterium]